MYIKFDHTKPSILEAMSISQMIIDEVSKTLSTLPIEDSPSEQLEKALHIFRNNDEALAFILINLGFNLAKPIPEIKEPDSTLEEPKVFDIRTGEALE